ncbi:acyl-CoA dehydrogenase family protein [Parapedomonas caeni]
MSDQQTLLEQTVTRLCLELAAAGDSAAAPASWQAVEALALRDLLLPEEAQGFAASWAAAGAVFRLIAAHGVALPIPEAVLARLWCHRLGIGGREPCGLAVALPAGDLAMDNLRVDPDARLWGEADGDADHVARLLLLGADRCWLVAVTADTVAGGAGRVRLAGARIVAEAALPAARADWLDELALLRACQMAGAIEGMLALSLAHVGTRQQFGRPLGRFQAIQQQLAVLAGESAAASCAAASACQARDRGEAGFEIAAAKLRANQAVGLATDIAHQVHGAIGFTRECALNVLTLPAHRWRSSLGGDRRWARALGRQVLAARPQPFWHWLTARSDAQLSPPEDTRS